MKTKFSNPYKFTAIKRTPGMSPGAVLEMLQRGMQGEREALQAGMLNTSGLLSNLFNEVELPEGYQSSIQNAISKKDKAYQDLVQGHVNKMFSKEAIRMKNEIIKQLSPGSYQEAADRYKANKEDWKKAQERGIANQLAVKGGKVAMQLPDGSVVYEDFDRYATLTPEQKRQVKLLDYNQAHQAFMGQDTHDSGEYTSYQNAAKVSDVFDTVLNRFSGLGSTEDSGESLAKIGSNLAEKIGNPQLADFIVKWKQGNKSNAQQLAYVRNSLVKGGMLSQEEMDALDGHYAQKLMSEGKDPSRENIQRAFMDDLNGVVKGKLDVATESGFTSANSILNGEGSGGQNNDKWNAWTAALNGVGHNVKSTTAFGDGFTSTTGMLTKIPNVSHKDPHTGKRVNLANGDLAKIGDVTKVYAADGEKLPEGADKNITYDGDKTYFAYLPVDANGAPVTDFEKSPAYKNNPQVRQLFDRIKSLEGSTSEKAKEELKMRVAQLKQLQPIGRFVAFTGVYRDANHNIWDGEDEDRIDFLRGKRIKDESLLQEYAATWDGEAEDYNDETILTADVYPGESHGLYKFTMFMPSYNAFYVESSQNPDSKIYSGTTQALDADDPFPGSRYESGGKLLEGQQKLSKFEQGEPFSGIKFLAPEDLM